MAVGGERPSPIVGTLTLGVDLAEFGRQSRALTKAHGAGLLVMKHDEVLLVTREAAEFTCHCVRCRDAVDEWLLAAGLRPRLRGFVSCVRCGDKRCPHAYDHGCDCHAKNEG